MLLLIKLGVHMSLTQKHYSQLHALSRHAKILSGISELLGWDQETYMPSDGAEFRGEQIKTLAGIIHKEKTGKGFSNALAKLINLQTGKLVVNDLGSAKAAAVKEWHRAYIRQIAQPQKFVEDFAQLTAQAVEIWRDSKHHNDFKSFQPLLKRIIEMNQKKCDLIGYADHPYDALLDEYEPGMKTAQVSTIFKDLQKAISNLVKKIAAQPQVNDKILYGNFPMDEQIAFGKRLLRDIGFDLSKGRLDFSEHPFSCTIYATDSRITTTIHPDDAIMKNISAIMHEGGHSLYGMGVPIEEYGTPLGDPLSMAMDESQSRWWETRIGLSKPFWDFYFPVLRQQFPNQFKKASVESFYLAINKVEPSLIRIEADEVTYPLHVILRFEIERALIEGSLKVNEIPEAWNAKTKELLGIAPPNDAKGCLQDIHWAFGAFGYFPSYTLGNLYASHLFTKFEKDHPDWKKRIAQGELIFVKNWLNNAVFQHGKRYSSNELLKKVTGKAFSADAYISYLNAKYAEIYSI